MYRPHSGLLAILLVGLIAFQAIANNGATPAPIQNVANNLCLCEHPALQPGSFDMTTGTLLRGASHPQVPAGDCVVITCAHLIERGMSPRQIKIRFLNDRGTYSGTVMKYDRVGDVCLIHVRGKPANLSGIDMFNGTEQPGDLRYYMGMAAGSRLVLRTSVVRQPVNGGDMTEIAGGSVSGMSGGPITTAQGELVSVISGSDAELGAPNPITIGCSGQRMMVVVRPLFPMLYAFRTRRAEALLGIPQGQSQCYPQCPQCPNPQQPPQYRPQPQPEYNNPDSMNGWKEIVPRVESLERSRDDHEQRIRDLESKVAQLQPIKKYEKRLTELENRPTMAAPVPIDYDRLANDVLDRLPEPQPGPAGPRGPKGDPGEPGTVSQDQLQELVSTVVSQLKQDPGFRGAPGEPGPQGEPGKSGTDVAKIQMDDDGYVYVTYSNGRKEQVGQLEIPMQNRSATPVYFDIVPRK